LNSAAADDVDRNWLGGGGLTVALPGTGRRVAGIDRLLNVVTQSGQ